MATDTSFGADDPASDTLASARSASRRVTQIAERLETVDLSTANKGEIVDALAELKRAEKAVETARKEVVGDELESRVEDGESIETPTVRATHVKGHNKYLKDDDAAVDALEEAGVDPDEVKTVKASKVAEKADEHDVEDAKEQVGEATYTYFRITR